MILAVAGGVFAQDITWSGEVRTGAKVTFGENVKDAKGDKVVNIQADDDDVPTGVKARLAAKVEDENWGLQFGLGANLFSGLKVDGLNVNALGKLLDDEATEEEQMGAIPIGNSNAVFIYDAHGWLDFAGDMIKVRAGLIDPGVWTTKGSEDWNVSSGLGFRLEVTPIEGLNVGALLNYGDAFAGPMKVADFLQETAFGFSYENAAMMGLYASAAFKLDSKYDVMNAYMGQPEGDNKASTLIIGFGITPMEALAVKVEGKIEIVGDYSKTGWMWFNEDVSYQVMAALKAGMGLTQQLPGDSDAGLGAGVDGEGMKMYLKFNPYAEYAVNEALLLHGEIPVAFAKNMADEFGFATIGLGAWAKYTVGGAWIQGGYSFTKKMEKYGDDLAHTVRVLAGFSF